MRNNNNLMKMCCWVSQSVKSFQTLVIGGGMSEEQADCPQAAEQNEL